MFLIVYLGKRYGAEAQEVLLHPKSEMNASFTTGHSLHPHPIFLLFPIPPTQRSDYCYLSPPWESGKTDGRPTEWFASMELH